MKLAIMLAVLMLCGYLILSEGELDSDYICGVSAANGEALCDFSNINALIPNIPESATYDVVDRIHLETIGKGGILHNELTVALIHNISNYQEVLSAEFNRNPDEIISDAYGNQFALFTGTKDVDISYQIIMYSLTDTPFIIVTKGQDLWPLHEPYNGDHYFYCYEYAWVGEWASLEVAQSWNVQKQSATTWYNKGSNLASQGKYNKVVEAFNRSIELDPTNSTVWFSKGNVLNSMVRYNESIEAYEKAIELTPNYTAAWNQKANVLNVVGKNEEAIIAFSRVIELNPNDADAWFNRANILASLGRYEEAIKDYDEAIKLKPPFIKAVLKKDKAQRDLDSRKTP